MKKLRGLILLGLLLAQVFSSMPCFAVTTTTWHATPTSEGAYLHDFAVDFYLSKDADGVSRMRVVETINGTFPEQDRTHGLVRVIPFTNQDGQNLTTASDHSLVTL